MSNAFANALKKQANLTKTENGAVTNSTTGSALLDLFSLGGAMRTASEDRIKQLVDKALAENEIHTLRILAYLRDVRGGQGERRFFKVAINHIASLKTNPDNILTRNLNSFIEVGRFDDLLALLGTPSESQMISVLKSQIAKDSTPNNKNISLLAKWLPSANTSSKNTRMLAHKLMKLLKLSPKHYRKMLSALRAKLNLVETKMRKLEFTSIDYSKIPSVAGMKYRKAFRKRDGERYTQFLESVNKGEAKINTAALTPYDLVSRVSPGDATVETMWKNLPDLFNGRTENSLVVADVSGSMSGAPMNVCLSLAIYIAERNKGHFHNTFMTFSNHPTVQLLQGNTLYEKVINLRRAHWEMSTNLEAAFTEILKIAVNNNLHQEELPTTLYIISDMEFNQCIKNSEVSNFDNAKNMFEQAGYKLPEVVFWNVNSRNDQSPVTKDEKGTFLVSGCSPSILKHALNKKTCTPIDFMMEVINSERYSTIV